jgi:aspartate/methionine/tyrosine aminotransferase
MTKYPPHKGSYTPNDQKTVNKPRRPAILINEQNPTGEVYRTDWLKRLFIQAKNVLHTCDTEQNPDFIPTYSDVYHKQVQLTSRLFLCSPTAHPSWQLLHV